MVMEFVLREMVDGLNDAEKAEYVFVHEGRVERHNIMTNPIDGTTVVFPIPQSAAFDAIEEFFPDDFDLLESVYRYNKYAMLGSASSKKIIMWYDRTK